VSFAQPQEIFACLTAGTCAEHTYRFVCVEQLFAADARVCMLDSIGWLRHIGVRHIMRRCRAVRRP